MKVGLTPEFDGLSHKDQIKLKEIEVVAVMWSMTAVTAERDDPNGLPSNPLHFPAHQNLFGQPQVICSVTCHNYLSWRI